MSDTGLQIKAYGTLPSEKTTEHIAVEGDIKIRIIVISFVGSILVLLTLGGIIGPIFEPTIFKDYWPRVLPIISGAVFGLIGFIVGAKVGLTKLE